MKKSKFTGEQMAFALSHADLEVSVPKVCQRMGLSEATFYRWNKLDVGVGSSELRKMWRLEEDN